VLGAVGIVAIVLAVALLRRASRPPAATSATPERVIPVSVAAASLRDLPIYLVGLGNVVPLQTVTLRGQVDGRLDKVLFQEGQAVHRGDVIAQIDPRPFTIQLHQAEAALAKDGAQQRNAKLNLERYQALRQKDLVPQQQVDDQATVVDQADAAMKADQAQLENARLQLDYARIRSPIDGVTGVRQVDPGNLVHPNDPTGIVVITQLDPISVIFTVTQDELPRVAQHLAEGRIEVEALSRDGARSLATGQLSVIDNQVSSSTATVRLKATFPNPQGSLWPNQFVKARMLLTKRSGVLVVPAVAVQRGPQGSFVYVVNHDDTVAMRPVEIESQQGESAIVGKGIAAGDNVVTDGQSQLRPGSKVKPRQQDPRSTASGGHP
jgi:multidrug efflux system membrane fusion protein